MLILYVLFLILLGLPFYILALRNLFDFFDIDNTTKGNFNLLLSFKYKYKQLILYFSYTFIGGLFTNVFYFFWPHFRELYL